MDQPTDEGYDEGHQDEDLSFQSGSGDHDGFSSPGGACREHESTEISNFNATPPQHVLMIDTGGGTLSTSFQPHRHRYPDDENPGGGDSASDSFYTPTGGDASTAGADTPSFSTAGAPSDETSFLGSSTVDTRSSLGEEDESSLEGGESSSMERTGLSSVEASAVNIFRTASAETREAEGDNEPPSSMQPETPRASNTARRVYSQQRNFKQWSNEVMSDVESMPDDELVDTIHTSNAVDSRTASLLAFPDILFVGSLEHDEEESSLKASHDSSVGGTTQMSPPPEVSRVTDYHVDEVNDDSVVELSGSENTEDVGALPFVETMLSRDMEESINLSPKEYSDAKDQPDNVDLDADNGHPGAVDADKKSSSSSAELVDLEISNAQKIRPKTMKNDPHLIVNDGASMQVSPGVHSALSMDISTNLHGESVPAHDGNRHDGSKLLSVSQDTASIPTDGATEISPPSVSGNVSEDPTKTGDEVATDSLTGGDEAIGGIDDFEQLLAEAEHDFLSMLGMDASTRNMLESAVAESHSESEKAIAEAAVLPLDSSGGHQPSIPVAQSSTHSGSKRDGPKKAAVDLGASRSASSRSLDASETTADEDSALLEAYFDSAVSHRSMVRGTPSKPSPENSSHAYQEAIMRSETEESMGSAASIRAILQKELQELGLTPNSGLNSPDPDPKPIPLSRPDNDTIIPDHHYPNTPTVDRPSSAAVAEKNPEDRSLSPVMQPAPGVAATTLSPRQAVDSAHESSEAAPSVEAAIPLGARHETAVKTPSMDGSIPQSTSEDQEKEETAITSRFQRTEEAQDSNIDALLTIKTPDQHDFQDCSSERQPMLVSNQEQCPAQDAGSISDHEVEGRETVKGQLAEIPRALVRVASDTEKLESSDGPKRPDGEKNPTVGSKEKAGTDEETQPGGSLSKGLSADETLALEMASGHSADAEEPNEESTDGHIGHMITPVGTETAEKAKKIGAPQRMSPTGMETTSKSLLPDDAPGAKTETLDQSQNDEKPSNDFGEAGNLERQDDAGMQMEPVPETESMTAPEIESRRTGGKIVQPSEELKSPAVDEGPNTDVSEGPDRQKQTEAGGDEVSVGILSNSGGVEPKCEIDTDRETQAAGSLSKGPPVDETLASEKTSEECVDPEDPNAERADSHKDHTKNPVGTENDAEKAKETDVPGVSPTGLESDTDREALSPKETQEAQAVATSNSGKRTERLEKSTTPTILEVGDEASNGYDKTENVAGHGEVDTQSDHKVEVPATKDEGHQRCDKPRLLIEVDEPAGDISPKSVDAESTNDIEDSVKAPEKARDISPKAEVAIPFDPLPESVQGTYDIAIKDAKTGTSEGEVLVSTAEASDAEKMGPSEGLKEVHDEKVGLNENSAKLLGTAEEKSEEDQSKHDRNQQPGGTEKHSLAWASGVEDKNTARQKTRIESKPPLFPKKTKELYENPDSFVEFLSKKLVAQVSSKEGIPDGNADTSPQVKRMSFDPEKSVFANFAGDWESLELSPPGSPPEPSFEQSDDDGSSSEGSQDSNSNFPAQFVHPEATTWDLVSEPVSAATSFGLDESTTRHPDYVMMPDDARTPSSSDAMIAPSIARADSLPSDVGVLRHQRSQKISFGDTSLSSSQHKRLEPSAGLLSASHRSPRKRPPSARASKQKHRLKWARRSRFPGLTLARNQELRTMNSPVADDPDETVSLGAKLLRDEIFRNLPGKKVSREGLLLKTVSSPNLGSTWVAAALRLERGEEAAANRDIFRAPRPSLVRQSKSFEMSRNEKLNQSVRSPERQINDDSPQKHSPERSPADEGDLILLGRLCCDLSSDQEGSMLHEELLTFTTLEPIDFPFQFSIMDDSIRYCGSLCWQQLLSCWRHDQLVKSLTKYPITQPLSREELVLYKEDDIETSHGRVRNESIDFLDLNGTKLFPDGTLRDALTGGNTRSEACALSLLRSLASRSPDREERPLRHVVQFSDVTSVKELLLAAESNLGVFTALIKSIVGFACYELSGEMGSMIDYNVCTKTSEATLKKAIRKYDGDILQVKDIIRGSIVFPTVGSLLCGLVFLAEICSDGSGWEAGDRRLRVVRVKNLFSSSSAMGGFDRSPLPTGYRHVLLNVRLDGGVLAEIQCHLSGMYDLLGETGHVLHRDLNNLMEACSGKLEGSFETYEKLLKSIIGNRAYLGSSPLPHVKNDPSDAGSREMGNERIPTHGNATSIASSSSCRERDLEGETSEPVVGDPELLASVGSAALKNPDDTSSTDPTQTDITPPRHRMEENDKKIPRPLQAGMGDRTSPVPKDPVSSLDKKLSELETPIAGLSLRNPDPVEEGHVTKPISWAILSSVTRDGLSRAAKSKLLERLLSKDEAPAPGTIMLAILECATSAASGSPRDLASFFCLHMLLNSLLRDGNVSLLRTKDGPIKEADLVEYSRRCLLRCFMLCCQATSLGMTGWLEYGENDPVVRLEEGPANLLNLIADSFAQELKWSEAQSVLQSLFLKYERELPSYHPLRIESVFNLASVAWINGNASFAAKLVGKATDAVSRRLVDLETSLLSFIQSYSSSDPSKIPSFRAEGLGSSLVALSCYVSNLQESIVGTMATDHRHSSGIIFIQQSLVADGFAVLANCKAAARAKLGSWSTGETTSGRYYWKIALTYYHKAFKGLSATKGFEDPRVCGAAFGMARCLRELGEHQKALELLSTVVAALETTPGSPIRPKAAMQPLSLHHFGDEKKRDPFLSRVLHLQSRAQAGEPQIQHHVTVALCLWQMSVLSVDGSPDEKGRARAFGLLHAASVSMQLALRELSDTDGMFQTTCIDILGKIENEAKKISKPLRRL